MMTMAELALRVEFLTVDHFRVVVSHLASNADGAADCDYLAYGLATEVLRFFFGNQWTNENIFSVHPEVSRQNRKGRKFMKTDSTEDAARIRHQQRVVILAQLAFNLQHVEGAKLRFARLRETDLESALGELECASLFARPELKFRFVFHENENPRRGEDYEGELTTPSGRILYCECKTKVEDGQPDSKGLWRTLDKARRQLPEDKPGLVAARIPEEWVKQPSVSQVVDEAFQQVFRQSDRLVGAVVLWEEWSNGPPWLVLYKFKPLLNDRSSHFGEDVAQTLQTLGQINNPSWINFFVLVQSILSG